MKVGEFLKEQNIQLGNISNPYCFIDEENKQFYTPNFLRLTIPICALFDVWQRRKRRKKIKMDVIDRRLLPNLSSNYFKIYNSLVFVCNELDSEDENVQILLEYLFIRFSSLEEMLYEFLESSEKVENFYDYEKKKREFLETLDLSDEVKSQLIKTCKFAKVAREIARNRLLHFPIYTLHPFRRDGKYMCEIRDENSEVVAIIWDISKFVALFAQLIYTYLRFIVEFTIRNFEADELSEESINYLQFVSRLEEPYEIYHGRYKKYLPLSIYKTPKQVIQGFKKVLEIIV